MVYKAPGLVEKPRSRALVKCLWSGLKAEAGSSHGQGSLRLGYYGI
jgi:hypothetical protein